MKVVKRELEEEGYKTEVVIAPDIKTGRPKVKVQKVKYLPKFKNANVLYRKTDELMRTVLADVTDSLKEAKKYEEEIDYATMIGKAIYVLMSETEELVKANRKEALKNLAKHLIDLVRSANKNDGDDKYQSEEMRKTIFELLN